MIEVRPVTSDNWLEAIALGVRKEQEQFVPSVVLSLAKAYIKPNGVHYEPRAIYAGDTMVGFYSFMFKPHDTRVCYIGGFLIDQKHQGKGYGTMAMQDFLDTVRLSFPDCEGVYLTVHPDNEDAAEFYSHFGFHKTGLVIEGEDAMALTLERVAE